jgi:2,5-diketo-D-gluconate reductase A
MTNDTTYAEPATTLSTGKQMPILGFGTWQINDGDAEPSVLHALQNGYRHIDTATGYSNEAGVGRGLRASGVDRDDVFVTTKMPPDNVGRERQTLEESLTKLGLDRVDLWLIHWPPDKQATPSAWAEFIKAQEEGLATSIGVSNYSLDQIDELISATGVAPAVNQIRWSPANHDPAVAAGLKERNVVLEGYSPFRASNLKDPTLVAIAEAHDANTAQVIVAWHVAHGYVVIPKSTHPERIVGNAAGARIELTGDEVAQIDGLAGSGD